MSNAARKLMPTPESDLGADPLDHGDAWEAEIDRRILDVRSGKVEPIAVETVAANLRAKLGWT